MSIDNIPSPAPTIQPDTQEFWEATGRGTLLLRHCRECDASMWYPRSSCPSCHSANVEWIEASGRGAIYTFTHTQKGMGLYQGADSYVLAYVTLAEGPTMMTNIVEADPAQLAIGDPVELVFHDTGEGNALPRFRPVAAASTTKVAS